VDVHIVGEFLSAKRHWTGDAQISKKTPKKIGDSKAEVINWLKRSLDAVKQAHLTKKPNDLARKVRIGERDAGRHLSPHYHPCQRALGAIGRRTHA
jgi:hypothetical protein